MDEKNHEQAALVTFHREGHVGFISVLPDEETLAARALGRAEEIAGNPPLAVQGAKEVLLFDEEVGLGQSLAYTAARSSMILPSEDLREARSAAVEKRKGEFKGA